ARGRGIQALESHASVKNLSIQHTGPGGGDDRRGVGVHARAGSTLDVSGFEITRSDSAGMLVSSSKGLDPAPVVHLFQARISTSSVGIYVPVADYEKLLTLDHVRFEDIAKSRIELQP